MKISNLIKMGAERLKISGIAEAETDARFLWFYVSGMDSMHLLLAKEQEADLSYEMEYRKVIEKRAERIPLQYITGRVGFMGLEFHTASDVLIPRMDTETLVEEALSLIAKCKTDAPRVLDMCCGSGCIGISIKKLADKCIVSLADISDAAISLTKENLELLGVSCDVIKSDLFENINNKYDFIISNPPYIKSDVIAGLMPEVKIYEPKLALDGSDDGLLFYRRIIYDAAKYLKDDSYVLFEIGNDQAEDVQHLLVDAGYKDVHVIKDLCGNDRVVYGHRCI